MPTLILATLIFIHGAIHLSYLAPRPPATAGGPTWPFVLDRSWLLSRLDVPPEVLRLLGLALTAVTFASFALAALAIAGMLPPSIAGAAVVLGAGSSLALLTLFFQPWLGLGLVIDAVLLWAAAGSVWTPSPI